MGLLVSYYLSWCFSAKFMLLCKLTCMISHIGMRTYIPIHSEFVIKNDTLMSDDGVICIILCICIQNDQQWFYSISYEICHIPALCYASLRFSFGQLSLSFTWDWMSNCETSLKKYETWEIFHLKPVRNVNISKAKQSKTTSSAYFMGNNFMCCCLNCDW